MRFALLTAGVTISYLLVATLVLFALWQDSLILELDRLGISTAAAEQASHRIWMQHRVVFLLFSLLALPSVFALAWVAQKPRTSTHTWAGVLKTATLVSLVVGSILNVVNQDVGAVDWLRAALNYAIPFAVAAYSGLKSASLPPVTSGSQTANSSDEALQ